MKLYELYWKQIGKSDKKRNKKYRLIHKNKVDRDIKYLNDDEPMHTFDIFYASKQNMPVIIDVHGGGWCYGTKEINENYCIKLAKMSSYNVVNINYRIVSSKNNVSYIDSVKDVISAINYIFNNDKYNFDLKNVFIVGDSAGGHLIALALNVMASKELQDEFKVEVNNVNIRAACFNCGAFDLKVMSDHDVVDFQFKNKLMRKLLYAVMPSYYSDVLKDNPLSKKYEILSNSLLSNNICPCLFMSAFGDFLSHICKKYYKIYQEKGIDSELYFVEESNKTVHNLVHVYNVIFYNWEESIKANQYMIDYFNKNLSK